MSVDVDLTEVDGERGLWVSETFVSIQGEGPSQGAPAAFLRLGRCNLRCSFCDTPYTWDETRFDLSEELELRTLDSLAEWILPASPGRLIVTGGEPLIQHRPLAALLGRVDLGRAERGELREVVEIETNGTIAPTPALAERVDQFNVSPKLANSGEPRARAWRRAALQSFAELRQSYFKFVVATEADADEAMTLAQELNVPLERVVFMPLASDVIELRERQSLVAELALARRVRFGSRLHLELFGGGRGV
jgi:7-carboxy-7-deazaguanine synthase